jgi:hypothetical protein
VQSVLAEVSPPSQSLAPALRKKSTLALRLALLVLCALYLAQIASPLRVNQDSAMFMGLGSSLADGHGLAYLPDSEHFPIGYPAVIAGFDRLGIACSATFITFNLVLLAGGLLAFCKVCRDDVGLGPNGALGVACLVLASWVVIKHATQAQSDVAFFGFEMIALWMISRVFHTRTYGRWLWALAALCLIVIATLIRSAGVTLLPPLAWALLGNFRTPLLRALFRSRASVFWILLTAAAVAATGYIFFTATRYGNEAIREFSNRGGAVFLIRLELNRLREAGSIATNVPSTISVWWVYIPLRIIGFVVLAKAAHSLWLRRTNLGVLDVFFCGYLAMLVAWPYEDSRFWMPLVPIIAAWGLLWGRNGGWSRPALGVLTAGMVSLGIIALSYSTWVSWSGEKFPDRYASGRNRAIYRAAYYDQWPEDPFLPLDADAVRLVRRYDRQRIVPSTQP